MDTLKEWEDKTGHRINMPCATCAQAGFEIIARDTQNISSIQQRRLGIPPDCDKANGLTLCNFCLAKHMYVGWLPVCCQLYIDIQDEIDMDNHFLEKTTPHTRE